MTRTPIHPGEMRRRYVTVDVFTDRAFGGNPLAVVLDAEGLSAARMQAIAAEFGYAETTFVLPPDDPAHTARVRIFTPRSELPFAGHPNIGTAFALGRAGLASGERLVFEEGAGLVPLDLLREGGEVRGAELTAPRPFARLSEMAAADVAAYAGLEADAVRTALHPVLVASVGLPFVFAELTSLEALGRARPDLPAFLRVAPRDGADAVFLHVADPDDPHVRHARMFAPLDGIWEDPATGSATAALAGLLADLRPEADCDITLTVRQGEAMGRPSLLRARALKRHGSPGPVTLRGDCVAMMEGTLALTAEA